jgi:MscS family membrane protein
MTETLANLLEVATSDRWIVEVFLTVFGTLLLSWLARRGLVRIERRIGDSHNLYDDALLYAARPPLIWLILLLGLCHAAGVADIRADAGIFELVDPIRTVGVVFLVALFALRGIRFVEEHLISGDYDGSSVDPTTATALGKLLRISVLITAVLTAAQSLGFSIGGVLAFGGVGGIAVGFAARDLLANFFGGLMVFLDRPFTVGEWVRSPEKEIEGTVEHIGWRLTRIRTFDQRPIYVPNAAFTTLVVENPSRMLNRRIFETIGVRYADVDALSTIIDEVRTMLEQHEEIEAEERTLMVNFNAFGASSLDFFVYTFTKTTVWAEYHRVKQDVLLRIAAIIRDHGAEVAFPTRTLHLEPPEAVSLATDADSARPPDGDR